MENYADKREDHAACTEQKQGVLNGLLHKLVLFGAENCDTITVVAIEIPITRETRAKIMESPQKQHLVRQGLKPPYPNAVHCIVQGLQEIS